MSTQTDTFAVRAERLLAAACTLPFIDRVERKKGEVLLGEWDNLREHARIYYKPMTMNKAVITNLFLAVTRNERVYLCQEFGVGIKHKHPHGSGILCSEGHSPLTCLLRQDKPLDLLMMGLSYFGAITPSSLAFPTPGVFNCSDCGEIIMEVPYYAKSFDKVYLYHRRHFKKCSSCRRIQWPFQIDRNTIKRRTWPYTGGRIRRLTCEICAKNMQDSIVCSCVVCHEQLYSRAYRGKKRCCHQAHELMYMSVHRWPLRDINSYVSTILSDRGNEDDIF